MSGYRYVRQFGGCSWTIRFSARFLFLVGEKIPLILYEISISIDEIEGFVVYRYFFHVFDPVQSFVSSFFLDEVGRFR